MLVRRSPIGNDCPKCSERLDDDGACSTPGCGWRPNKAAALYACAGKCGMRLALNQLYGCDDGLQRCMSCKIPWLRSRRSEDTDRCTEPGCTKTVREHREEFRRLLSNIEARIITADNKEGTDAGSISSPF